MKVALVHDYLREYGGAERVLEALHQMFPTAPLYTAFVDKKALGIHWQRFENWEIHESIASRIPFIHKLYSPLRLLSAYFFEGFDLSEYDVVISSTNMYMAKAVITGPKTLHLCYCHTPPRSLYGFTTMTDWKKNPVTHVGGELINTILRKIDYLTAQRPDVMIANSKTTQERIQKYYRRDSVVIYPPVELPSDEGKKEVASEPYYLYVNRLAYAKHPEIAVEACTKLGVSLKVVGQGKMEERLRALAGPSIEFLGGVSDRELSRLYRGAKALLYPVEQEDFGIVPVEAAACGIPVIAHNSGGPRETILDGKTGVLFDELTTEGLLKAMKRFETLSFDPSKLQKHAALFDTAHFQNAIEKLLPQK